MLIEVTKSDYVKENDRALNEKLEIWGNHISSSQFEDDQDEFSPGNKLLIKTNYLLEYLDMYDLPMSDGIKEVSKKYLNEWQALKVELEKIKNEDIKEFNKKMKVSDFPILFFQ